jgi:hypothetical protein
LGIGRLFFTFVVKNFGNKLLACFLPEKPKAHRNESYVINVIQKIKEWGRQMPLAVPFNHHIF